MVASATGTYLVVPAVGERACPNIQELKGALIRTLEKVPKELCLPVSNKDLVFILEVGQVPSKEFVIPLQAALTEPTPAYCACMIRVLRSSRGSNARSTPDAWIRA